MAEPMDYYDVQAMVEKAVSEERHARIRHVEETARELREAIGEERIERQESDDTLQRVIDSRTERFV